MRILILAQWCHPEPDFKSVTFAKGLKRLGHEVEVLTGFPNYPGGRLYDGYRIRLFQREVVDGVPVVRVPLYPSHDRSFLGRVLNYVSFAVSAAVLGPFLARKPDVIYVYHPPATIGLPAIVLSLALRAPFVYDVQDLWPDTLVSTGMVSSPLVLSAIGAWCRIVYKRAGRIVVLGEGFRRALVDRRVPESRIEVIYNWCDESQAVSDEPTDEVRSELGFNGRFTVLFAGTMGRAQALDSVMDAARIVAAEAPEVLFAFIGGGIDVERLRGRASSLGLRNVLFLPRRPPSEIGPVLKSADVLLVHLRDDRLFDITIPSKTQAYMAVGRPVLMAVRGNAAELVERAEAGLVCEPENPADIAGTVLRMFKMPGDELAGFGDRGRSFYEREMSFSTGLERFNEVFMGLLKRKS
jgi:glycosyltransferase involved in cell wall biosynthesis